MKIITKMINTLVAIFLIINIVGLFLVNVHFAGLHFVKSATNELTPLINNNDLVLYQKQDNYQENDIIIYNIENKYSIAKVKSRSEYLTYIKDNTDFWKKVKITVGILAGFRYEITGLANSQIAAYCL